MKNIFLLSLLISTFPLFSQNTSFNTYDWEADYLRYRPIQYSPVKNVDEISFTIFKKGKQSGKAIKKFNKEGFVTEFNEYEKGKEKWSTIISYNDKNKFTEIRHIKNEKPHRRTVYNRNESGNLLAQLRYKKENEKIWSKDTWIYDNNDCLKERTIYKNGEKIWQRYVFERRDDCELTKSVLYNAKGKEKYTWTYDCKKEGEVLTKKKNTEQVCRWEEVTPDILTKVYQTFDEKGKIIKNVSKYTLQDTLILEWAKYDENDLLMFKSTYDKDYKKPLMQESYKKGKLKYRWETRYENDLIVYRSYYSRGKQQRRSEYVYNEENLLTKYNYFGSKGELRKTIALNYP